MPNLSPTSITEVGPVVGAGPDPAPWALKVLATASLVSLLVLPSFVILRSPFHFVVAAAIAAGCAASAVIVALSRPRLNLRVLTLPLLLLLGPLIQGRNISADLLVLATLAVGLGVGVWWRWSQGVLLASLALSTSLLALETLTKQHLYSSFFGQQVFVYTAATGFRARGIIGHPVPSAAVAVAIAAALWWMSDRAGTRQRVLIRALSSGAVLVALLATGTRAALLVIGALIVVRLVVGISKRRKAEPRVVAGVLIASALAPLALMQGLPSWLLESRLLSFTSLKGSSSLENRLSFIRLGQNLQREDVISVTLGHGIRSLEQVLHTYSVSSGPSTVDNQYATILWDAGILGMVALVALVVVAAKRLGPREGLGNLGAAAALLFSLLLFGLFFDVLYTRACLLLVGLAVGTCARSTSVHTRSLSLRSCSTEMVVQPR